MEAIEVVTKEHILHTSDDLFRRYGYVKVSMNDIAIACDMGRSSLYYHYKNKLELFQELALRKFQDVLELAALKISKQFSLSKNLELFNIEKVAQLNILTKKYDLIINDLRTHPDTLLCVKNQNIQYQNKIVEKILSWAVDNKEIAPIGSTEQLNLLANAITCTYCGIEQELFLIGQIDNLEYRVTWLASILQKGLQ